MWNLNDFLQHSPASLRFPISARLHELNLRHELIGRDYDPPRDVFPRLPPMLHLACLILKIRLEGEEKAGLFCMRSTNLHFSSNQFLNVFLKNSPRYSTLFDQPPAPRRPGRCGPRPGAEGCTAGGPIGWSTGAARWCGSDGTVTCIIYDFFLCLGFSAPAYMLLN